MTLIESIDALQAEFNKARDMQKISITQNAAAEVTAIEAKQADVNKRFDAVKELLATFPEEAPVVAPPVAAPPVTEPVTP